MSFFTLTDINKKYQGTDFRLENISFSISRGMILALLGESGCGKTSLLRIISGLEIPDRGIIMLDGKILFDKSTYVPPEYRQIGYVFQDYALFPHLNVKENIRFGIEHLSKTEQQLRIQQMLELFDLTEYAHRYPSELSGGEQQRVALARALALQPALLLLDEPFSSLDIIRKETFKRELKSILQKTNATAIFVTHDTTEAMFLADKIIVLKEGKIMQQGHPEKLYRYPVNRYVASFFGKANFFETKISDKSQLLPFAINLKKIDVSRYDKVDICVRPDAFTIHEKGAISGVVERAVFLGPVLELYVRVLFSDKLFDFIIHTNTQVSYQPGEIIRFDVAAESVHFLLGERADDD